MTRLVLPEQTRPGQGKPGPAGAFIPCKALACFVLSRVLLLRLCRVNGVHAKQVAKRSLIFTVFIREYKLVSAVCLTFVGVRRAERGGQTRTSSCD